MRQNLDGIAGESVLLQKLDILISTQLAKLSERKGKARPSDRNFYADDTQPPPTNREEMRFRTHFN